MRGLRGAGEPVELARRLEQQLEREPANAERWLELARLRAERLHRTGGAASAYREVLKLEPGCREALQGLRQQIDNEKGLQESILREFRSQLGRSSKPGGGGRATPAPQHNPPGSPGRPGSRPGTAGQHVH